MIRKSLIPLTIVSFFLVSCNINTSVEGTGGKVVESINDFEKTEIISGGPAKADGSSELLLGIHLKNSDNSSVPSYRPQYEIQGNPGVNAGDCTSSDNNGISACVLTSTVPGSFAFVLTNAKVGLTKTLVFSPVLGHEKLSIVSGGLVNASTAQGSKVQVTLGQPLAGNNRVTPDGHKVKFSMQGVNQ